jgi:hypothetical protein
MWSRVGKHWSGTHRAMDEMFNGKTFGDTSVGDSSLRHPMLLKGECRKGGPGWGREIQKILLAWIEGEGWLRGGGEGMVDQIGRGGSTLEPKSVSK